MKYHNKIVKFAPVVAAAVFISCLIDTSHAQYTSNLRASIMPLPSGAKRIPSPIPKPTPIPPPSTSYIKLNVNHQKQESMLCYPTSASMLLSTRGWNYPPRQIKLATMGYVWYGPSTPFSYWSPMSASGLFKGLDFLGVKGWRLESYLSTDFQKGLDEIKDALRKGFPVIILVWYGPGIGHAMVVSGYDDRNQRLIMNDPGMSAPGIAYYSYVSLRDTYWKNSINRRSVVLMNPKTTTFCGSIMFSAPSSSKDPSMDILY
jgi:hypothetical protein